MISMDHRGMYEEYTFPQTYSTYNEYKFIREESELRYMIHRKYLRLLGHFIETMEPHIVRSILVVINYIMILIHIFLILINIF